MKYIKLILLWSIGSLGAIIGITTLTNTLNVITWHLIFTLGFIVISLLIIPTINKLIKIEIKNWLIYLLFLTSFLGTVFGGTEATSNVYIADEEPLTFVFHIDELTLQQNDTTYLKQGKYGAWGGSYKMPQDISLGYYLAEYSCSLKINLPDEYQILNIERQVVLYPSIWSDSNSSLSQFKSFEDLSHKSNKDIELIDSYYNWNVDYENDIQSLSDKFKSITKHELENAIIEDAIKHPYRYQDDGTNTRNSWLEYVNRYNVGDFVTELRSGTFNITPYEIYLVLTYEHKGNVYKKVFETDVIFGN